MSYVAVMMPPRICQKFSGGPTFDTTVGRSKAGYRKANQNRMDALWKWNADMFLKDDPLRDQLTAFFMVLGGMANTFRFRDYADHMVGMKWVGTTRTFFAAADVPQLATGNGVLTAFQLQRAYTVTLNTGTATVYRKITKPSAPETGYAGARVWFGTTEQTTGWTLDYDTGILTFTTAPPNTTVIRVAFMFECHAAIMEDTMEIDLGKPGTGQVTLEIEEVFG